jgi:hypothetical protein
MSSALFVLMQQKKLQIWGFAWIKNCHYHVLKKHLNITTPQSEINAISIINNNGWGTD